MDLDNIQTHARIMSWTHRLYMMLSAMIIISLWLWNFDVIGSGVHVVAWTVLSAVVLGWGVTAIRLMRVRRSDVSAVHTHSLTLRILGSTLLGASLFILLFIR